MKLLLAHKDDESRRVLNAAPNGLGYETTVVSDGAEAWTILDAPDAPDMAILERDLPTINGAELCRRVRARHREPYIYVLILSSHADQWANVESLEAGADDYIVAPFEEHELQVRLRAGKRIVELQKDLVRQRENLLKRARCGPSSRQSY